MAALCGIVVPLLPRSTTQGPLQNARIHGQTPFPLLRLRGSAHRTCPHDFLLSYNKPTYSRPRDWRRKYRQWWRAPHKVSENTLDACRSVLPAIVVAVPSAQISPCTPLLIIVLLIIGISRFRVFARRIPPTRRNPVAFARIIGVEELLA